MHGAKGQEKYKRAGMSWNPKLRVGSDSSFPRAHRDLVVVCLSLLQGEGFRMQDLP